MTIINSSKLFGNLNVLLTSKDVESAPRRGGREGRWAGMRGRGDSNRCVWVWVWAGGTV